MAEETLESAPVLSTPDTRIFEEQKPDVSTLPRLSDEQIHITYEIERCVSEIRKGRWRRIALQFPDHMLVDAPRVFQYLARGLKNATREEKKNPVTPSKIEARALSADGLERPSVETKPQEPEKLFILADTSYGACCVDEVAAEHASADVVIHYGRSCLSPTARLPVIYVFTKPPLDVEAMYHSFKDTYTPNEKILLMADIPYQTYLAPLAERLKADGYTSLFVTSVVHDTTSLLPNRTLPAEVTAGQAALTDYTLFHVSDPPPSLLLTISSRVRSIHIYPTTPSNFADKTTTQTSLPTTPTTLLLRRRYALLTRLTTAPIIGILINTLSVASYMSMLSHLKRLIRAAGKKSYTFVVGKVNAAKIANFAEVGGWVVVGCWESSLFDSSEFWKPVVTPWELERALQSDAERVWTGDWRSDFGGVLGSAVNGAQVVDGTQESAAEREHAEAEAEAEEEDSEEESAPPEFDLRTGRYVSHSRPMAPATTKKSKSSTQSKSTAQTLIKRANGDLATIGGEISPAAEFFKNKRSWQGLGSDYDVEHDAEGGLLAREAAKMEIGRSGIARGYVVGEQVEKR